MTVDIKKITIEQAISVLKHFNKEQEARIYQIAPTERTDGYVMITIDVSYKAELETLTTEPLNNDDESD